MDATLSILPNDVATLKSVVAQQRLTLAQREALVLEQQQTIGQLQRENQGLSHRLDLALRRIYGRSAEKIDPGQLLLFGQAMEQVALAMEAQADAQDADAADQAQCQSPQRRGHGRRPLPVDLPRHRLEHAVAPHELTCPCCQQPRVRLGEEVSEQLDYVPASLFVIQHVRPKLVCPHCEDGGVVTAQKPANFQGVIDKGLPGPGLVPAPAMRPGRIRPWP